MKVLKRCWWQTCALSLRTLNNLAYLKKLITTLYKCDYMSDCMCHVNAYTATVLYFLYIY